jgi:hypothetical protein
MATDAQLDPTRSPAAHRKHLKRIAKTIDYWQYRAERATHAHRKRRLRQLREQGVVVSKIPKCYDVF